MSLLLLLLLLSLLLLLLLLFLCLFVCAAAVAVSVLLLFLLLFLLYLSSVTAVVFASSTWWSRSSAAHAIAAHAGTVVDASCEHPAANAAAALSRPV